MQLIKREQERGSKGKRGRGGERPMSIANTHTQPKTDTHRAHRAHTDTRSSHTHTHTL